MLGMDARVAQVAVDVPLPHLDRPFDYAIPDGVDCAPGVRVRVRFAGRLVDGYVLSTASESSVPGKLAKLERVVSAEVVAQPQVLRLARAVADHYCGTLVDVLRLAIPKRHATAEAAPSPKFDDPDVSIPARVLPEYLDGESFLSALRRGAAPRAAWTAVPVAGPAGDVHEGVLDAAAATLASGRSVLVIVPDQQRLDRILKQSAIRFGKSSVLGLAAELGPATRYRHFLAGKRGAARFVVGTRAAVFAPIPNLGLLAVVDEGSDLLAEKRAPYCHARDVAALRVHQDKCGLLFASVARCAETQRFVESGWMGEISLPGDEIRRRAPLVRVASDTDLALDRDEFALVSRMPHDVFQAIRAGLSLGPVLVQVPRAGYTVETESGLRIGVKRTAEELGKAFPRTPVILATGEKLVDSVGASPTLVVATPGAEPSAEGGYPTAIVLDVAVSLGRVDLRAAEETLRRWFWLASLVRPASRGGTLMLVGQLSSPAVQALIRLDARGFAERELAARTEVGFPPAAKLVQLLGPSDALALLKQALIPSGLALTWGLALDAEDGQTSLVVRCSHSEAAALLAAIKVELSVRSSRKLAPIRVQVDPILIE